MPTYDGPRFVESEDEHHDDRRSTIASRHEDIHIRNYDYRHGYDLDLVVETESGDAVLTNRYFLQPGAFRSLDDLFDRGRYRVTVRLDDGSPQQLQCEVDETPTSGILIELGNGQVSLTDGIYV